MEVENEWKITIYRSIAPVRCRGDPRFGFTHVAVLDFPYLLNLAYLPAFMLSWIQHRLKRRQEPAKLRAKYTHFRILVIGRANAGKTTVLKRVCNTTEDPCIYDEENHNLVSCLLRWLLCS